MTETQVQRLSGKKIKITYKQHTKWGIRDITLEGIVTHLQTQKLILQGFAKQKLLLIGTCILMKEKG